MVYFPEPSIRTSTTRETGNNPNVQALNQIGNTTKPNTPMIVSVAKTEINTKDSNLAQKFASGKGEPVHSIFEEKAQQKNENAQPLVALIASMLSILGATTLGSAYNPALADAVQKSLEKNIALINNKGLGEDKNPKEDLVEKHLKDKQKEEQAPIQA